MNLDTRPTLHAPRRSSASPLPSSARRDTSTAPKGHDAVLGSIMRQASNITVTKLSGETLTGKLVGRDKFTLTIQMPGGVRVVVYKHAIEEFSAPNPQSTVSIASLQPA